MTDADPRELASANPPRPLRWATSKVIRRIASASHAQARRAKVERARRRAGKPHVVEYFHQVDDGYSHLAAQLLKPLAESYDIELVCHLVPTRTGPNAPEPELLAKLSRNDAAAVAPHYGLRFPGTDAPPPASMDLAQRLLAGARDGAAFSEVAPLAGALRENGLDENTLVIFTSDNGAAGYLGLNDVNKPFRGWKLTLFEGGIHVPFFMQWPARLEAGTTFSHPVAHLDIFATAAAAAGAAVPDDRIIDGVDLLPRLADASLGAPHDTLFWREGHHQAVRYGDWKLIVSDQAPAAVRQTRRWLFNLADDPTERRDLEKELPEQVAALQARLDAHNAAQVEPLWPSVIDGPQLIDKTEAEEYAPGDEYIYWPN